MPGNMIGPLTRELLHWVTGLMHGWMYWDTCWMWPQQCTADWVHCCHSSSNNSMI